LIGFIEKYVVKSYICNKILIKIETVYYMDFKLTEEHEMIRQAARDFANNELKPGVIERDENEEFPKEQIKKLGELGFMGMMASPDYGGGGNGYHFLCLSDGRTFQSRCFCIGCRFGK